MRLEGGELVGEIGEGGVMVAEGGGVSLGRERRWWLGERAQWQGGDGISPRPVCRILASGCIVSQSTYMQPPVSRVRRVEASGTESLHCGGNEGTARRVVVKPSTPRLYLQFIIIIIIFSAVVNPIPSYA